MNGRNRLVEQVLARMVAAGGRRTASRQAILEVMASSGSHITAEEIAGRVQERFASVDASTVYRTLETLEALGLVHRVRLSRGPAVYHLLEEAHQHLLCEACGSVEALPLETLAPLVEVVHQEHDFRIDHRHVALVGRCKACQEETRPARRKQGRVDPARRRQALRRRRDVKSLSGLSVHVG